MKHDSVLEKCACKREKCACKVEFDSTCKKCACKREKCAYKFLLQKSVPGISSIHVTTSNQHSILLYKWKSVPAN